MLNFPFQLQNIQHVQHLPDIFSLQKALIHFFQNSHGREICSVQQFLDQYELSGTTWTYSNPSKVASATPQHPHATFWCYSRTCDFCWKPWWSSKHRTVPWGKMSQELRVTTAQTRQQPGCNQGKPRVVTEPGSVNSSVIITQGKVLSPGGV